MIQPIGCVRAPEKPGKGFAALQRNDTAEPRRCQGERVASYSDTTSMAKLSMVAA